MRAAAIVVSVGALISAMQASGAAADHQPVASQERGVGYWTADRAAAAAPRDVVLDHAASGHGPVPLSHDGQGDESGAPWPDGSTDPVDDLAGKVLFTLGTRDYVCSASTVDAESGSTWVVLTAGHCAWDDDAGFALNWVFVPNYEDVLRFGCVGADRATNGAESCYAAASLHPAAGWVEPGDDYDHDAAFARMDSPLPTELYDGVDLPVVTADSAIGVVATSFGYPAAKKYSGSDLVYCHGSTTPGPGSYSSNAMLGCDMTGGSSGGPWYIDDGRGGRLAVSLNSFGLRGLNGFMFGPVFDTQVLDALTDASGDDPPPTITPGATGIAEGDGATVIVNVPVTLSSPSAEEITVDWATLDTGQPGVATEGVDYVAANGTVTFLPGETVHVVPITVIGDTDIEPPLLYGEWILVAFSNPSPNATLDLRFFGLGIGIIIDDDS